MIDILDVQTIKSYLTSHYFDLDSINPIVNSGVSSNVFRILMNDGSTKYLKISHDNYLDFDIQKIVTDRLISLGVKTPKIIYVDQTLGILGKKLMVLESIDGAVATIPEVINNTESISSQVATINSFDIIGFGNIKYMHGTFYGDFGNYFDYFNNYYDKYTKFILPYINVKADYFPKILEKISTVLLASKSLVMGRLVHGDIPGHIFTKDSLFTGIIDFDDIKSSMPFYDMLECHYSYPQNCYNLLNEAWKQKVNFSTYANFYILEHILYLIEEMCNVTKTYLQFKDERYNTAEKYLSGLDILINESGL